MKINNLHQKHTLIIEDSDVGLAAAKASNAHTLKVKNTTEETTYEFITNYIKGLI